MRDAAAKPVALGDPVPDGDREAMLEREPDAVEESNAEDEGVADSVAPTDLDLVGTELGEVVLV